MIDGYDACCPEDNPMALFLSIFPIVLLIWLMVKKNSMPSYVALPITAALIYAIKLFYFGDDAMLLNATAASGLVSTLTPITVIFGAIMFNRMMETTGCIDVIRKWLATISPNRTRILRCSRYSNLVRLRTFGPGSKKHYGNRYANRRNALLCWFHHPCYRLELHRTLG